MIKVNVRQPRPVIRKQDGEVMWTPVVSADDLRCVEFVGVVRLSMIRTLSKPEYLQVVWTLEGVRREYTPKLATVSGIGQTQTLNLGMDDLDGPYAAPQRTTSFERLYKCR